MKKVTLVILLLGALNFAQAQQKANTVTFTKYTEAMNAKMQKADQAKDRKQVLELMTTWLREYDRQEAAEQKHFKSYLSNIYYNLACYQALESQQELAVTNFQKAVEAGYVNYAHSLKDSDLDPLRQDKRFKTALAQMRLKGDYGYILKTAGDYRPKAYPALPSFTYQTASAPELVTFRKKFNLDSISGNGDEISRIKNLLYWVHNLIRHDGNSNNPASRNAVDLINVCQKENRGLNCRMLATILKDAYQAEGFTARMVTCMPKDTADFDCHVINVVWSKTLNKWLWMDPTNNAYVSDNKGNLLSIQEVRERLIRKRPLVLNADANWNNKQKQTKENYLDSYMSKNLYWLQCSVKSEWDLESRKENQSPVEYINLYPGEYSTIGSLPKKANRSQVIYAAGDPAMFWSKP
ncbi:hypothetical protein CKK33_01790 [Mucilaginibacter sp. MD40]|uniref:TPR end-of-group domain-containing protein n=1 Tax=Mucilaginibacter sp. MD40 TaxID=2029590 RepID=UPI000BACB539|nr:transglutaminase domain-containing protein [Mucilaginibacter sp. MD40]PAW92290.1 hypothetical protein CKK33_01790 [Mucilaginibacter sp. MD40]